MVWERGSVEYNSICQTSLCKRQNELAYSSSNSKEKIMVDILRTGWLHIDSIQGAKNTSQFLSFSPIAPMFFFCRVHFHLTTLPFLSYKAPANIYLHLIMLDQLHSFPESITVATKLRHSDWFKSVASQSVGQVNSTNHMADIMRGWLFKNIQDTQSGQQITRAVQQYGSGSTADLLLMSFFPPKPPCQQNFSQHAASLHYPFPKSWQKSSELKIKSS